MDQYITGRWIVDSLGVTTVVLTLDGAMFFVLQLDMMVLFRLPQPQEAVMLDLPPLVVRVIPENICVEVILMSGCNLEMLESGGAWPQHSQPECYRFRCQPFDTQ